MEKAKRALSDLYGRIFRSWKTTLSGFILAVFTGMMIAGKITTNEYLGLLGGIGTIIALFAKDK